MLFVVTETGQRKVTGRDAWRMLAILWVTLLTVQVITGIALRVVNRQVLTETLFLLNAFLSAVALLGPVLLFGWRQGWCWRSAFRWQWVPFRVIVLTCFGTLALGVAISQIVLWLVQWLNALPFVQQSHLEEILKAVVETTSPSLFLLAVTLPALPEELVFRGVIQQGFESRYPLPVAIGLTGAAFVLFHLDLVQSVSIFPIALFWGWVVSRSGSVVPTIFAHALQNGITVVAVFANASQQTERAGTPFQWMEPAPKAALGGLLLWLVIVFCLVRSLPPLRRGDLHEPTATDGRADARQTGAADGRDGGGCFSIDERGGLAG